MDSNPVAVGSPIELHISGPSNVFPGDTIEDCALPLWPFTGFAQPVDNSPTVNSMNAGRTVPVKFSLGGDRGLGSSKPGYPRVTTVSCEGNATADPIEETETAGVSTLTYDAASDRYTYLWKTDKNWAGSCRNLELKFSDGSVQTALFDFEVRRPRLLIRPNHRGREGLVNKTRGLLGGRRRVATPRTHRRRSAAATVRASPGRVV